MIHYCSKFIDENGEIDTYDTDDDALDAPPEGGLPALDQPREPRAARQTGVLATLEQGSRCTQMAVKQRKNQVLMNVILASASARRYEILRQHGVTPVVMPSDVEEVLPPHVAELGIADIVMYLAHIKAQGVYEQMRRTAGEAEPPKPAIILAADTVIYKDGIIGKPLDEADAFRILSELRNTFHEVYTGVSLIDMASGAERQLYDVTKVFFKDYPDAEIYRYIKEEPPFDKSGAYGIQTSWQTNVEKIEGDIENVMGLPWQRLGLGE
jgi:septum formation protein